MFSKSCGVVAVMGLREMSLARARLARYLSCWRRLGSVSMA